MINLLKKLPALFLLIGCSSAQAVPLIYIMHGTITEVASELSGPVFEVGDTWSATFVIDSNAVGISEPTNRTIFKNQLNGEVLIEGQDFSSTSENTVFVRNDFESAVNDYIDSFGIEINYLGSISIGGEGVSIFKFAVIDRTGAMFSDQSLIGTVLGGLNTFDYSSASEEVSYGTDDLIAYFQIKMGSTGSASFQGYRATIDMLTASVISVPEPTTLALMGLGLAGIGYRRYRSA